MSFKVRNWPAYEAGLRRRGSLTLWIEDAALKCWQTTGPSGQARYTGAAIQTSLMLRTAIKQAGYNGEKTVLLSPNDPQYRKAMADVSGPMMISVGLNVEVQSMDWGTAIVRRENKLPADKRGLERVLHHGQRPGHADPSLAFSARHRRNRLVRLDQEPPHRGVARGLG
jgi:hypothetical protein